MAELTEQQREAVEQFQTYQRQLQSVLIQKESMRVHEAETEKALEELNATKTATAYKLVGQIMVSKTVEELKKDLNDSKEAIQVRLNSLGKSEEKINEKLKELQVKLKEFIG